MNRNERIAMALVTVAAVLVIAANIWALAYSTSGTPSYEPAREAR